MNLRLFPWFYMKVEGPQFLVSDLPAYSRLGFQGRTPWMGVTM